MLGLHFLVGSRVGRWFVRERMGVRLDLSTWPEENAPDRFDVQPLDPVQCVRAIAPIPSLLVHGERDDYFPVEHGQRLFDSASEVAEHRTTLWVKRGMGHAEAATTPELVAEIAQWIRQEAARKLG